MSDALIDTPYVRSPKWKSLQGINFYNEEQDIETVTNKFRTWVADIIDLSDFQYAYFVNGCTDAINQWLATEQREWQFLSGDYEYPRFINKSGEKVTSIRDDKVLYLTNPTASTGNFLDKDFIDSIECPVMLDCAYITATSKKIVYMPKNTEQVWFSLSKGFGLVNQRCGFVFTRQKHPSLHIMQNFYCWNYNSLNIADYIMDMFDVDAPYNISRDVQLQLCKELDIIPSDTYFIGNSTKEMYKKRRRSGDIARLCLTPLMKHEQYI